MATRNTVTPTDNKIKHLLEAEKKLTGYINELEAHKDELPAGAFRHLTTAENLMTNKRAKMEKDAGR